MNPSDAVLQQQLVVICGPGGVGKTTTSAAFGLAAAKAGRRALVITIDPAKRLGEALGEEGLGNEPRQIPPHLVDPDGTDGGEVWALMLNQEQTADSLISESASTAESARRVLGNRIYRVLASALASTEYMAVERLYQLYNSGDFDFFVLDTPPSKNALDFLDSPQWASRVLDRRIIHWFLRTANREQDLEEDVGVAGRLMYRTAMIVADLLGRLLGKEFYEELVDFFEGFAEIADDLRDHADEVDSLLRRSSTTFYVASSPEQSAVEETIRLARELRHRGLGFGGFVVNRVEQEIVRPDDEHVQSWFEKAKIPEGRRGPIGEALAATWRDQIAIRARDEAAIRQLDHAAGRAAAIHAVPRLGDDLAGIQDLARFAECLMGTAGKTR